MKKFLTAVLILALLLFPSGCAAKTTALNIGDASKIELRSGNTGKQIDVTDEDSIRHITENINSMKLTDEGKADADGWSYSLSWFDKDGNCLKQITLTDDKTVIFEGNRYSAADGGEKADTAFLDKLLNEA